MTNAQVILIVEDEIMILVDLAEQLRRCGYSVVECLDATQAIAILETGSPVDLVFSDIQMPGPTDGLDLAHWVSRHRPDVKIILTSGNPELLSHGAIHIGCATVSKPYIHRDLIESFKLLLAAARGSEQGEPDTS